MERCDGRETPALNVGCKIGCNDFAPFTVVREWGPAEDDERRVLVEELVVGSRCSGSPRSEGKQRPGSQCSLQKYVSRYRRLLVSVTVVSEARRDSNATFHWRLATSSDWSASEGSSRTNDSSQLMLRVKRK